MVRTAERNNTEAEQQLSYGQRKKRLAFAKLAKMLGRALISTAPMWGLKGWPGVLLSFLGYFGKQAIGRRKQLGRQRFSQPRDELEHQDGES